MTLALVLLLAGAAAPPAAQSAIGAAIPRARIAASATCKVGLAATDAVGAVVVASTGGQVTIADVHAVIAVNAKSGWTVHELPRALDVDGVGAVKDFLGDFVHAGTLDPVPGVQCAKPLAPGGDVMAKLGKFLVPDARLRKTPQVCFQADSVYNSWACFTDDGAKATLSFVQLQAD